jgi:hypothetical protein
MKVFRYRSGVYCFVLVFLAIWCGGWMTAVISSFSKPTVQINDKTVPIQQALPLLLFCLAVGIAVSLVFLWFLLYVINTRVEIQFDKIASFNWQGSRVVDASLASAKILGGRGTIQKNSPVLIETDGGTIKVYTSLNNFQEFLDIIEEQGSKVSQDPGATVEFSEPIVEAKQYTYR